MSAFLRCAALLSGLLACCQGMPAAARESEDPSKTCTWKTASVASVEEIAAGYLRWDGKCVRVRALHAIGRYRTENRLLAERMAVLERDEPRGHSLTINDRRDLAHDGHRPRWEEVLGTVGSCTIASDAVGQMARANPDRMFMLTGLCHYTLDHFIVPLAYRPVNGPAVARIRRAELVPAQVELWLVGKTGGGLLHREAAERMFAALERADFDAYLKLDDPDLVETLTGAGSRNPDEETQEEVEDSRREFAKRVAAWRASGIGLDGPSHALVERLESAALEGEAALSGREDNEPVVWCRLREGATADDLPALWRDIDNDPARPYFCVDAGVWGNALQGRVPHASVRLFRWGFAEAID